MRPRRLDGYREPEQITDRSLLMFLEEYGTDGLLKHARQMCKRIYGLVLERDYQRDRANGLAERLKQYESPKPTPVVTRSYRSGPECDG
jgi:hypothetical protein